MGRRSRRGVMSEQFKYELAKDLGFYETVQREGWGGIRTKDAGNMVKRAIQIAEQTLAQQTQVQAQAVQTPYRPAMQQPVPPPVSFGPSGFAAGVSSYPVQNVPYYAASHGTPANASSYSPYTGQ